MDNSLSFLFRNATTTAKVVDEPPPVENDTFKIPTRSINRVMVTTLLGMELSIPVIFFSLYTNYVGCSSVQVSLQIKLSRSYSHYH